MTRGFCIFLLSLFAASCHVAAHDFRVLVFSKTTVYRHESIPAAIQAMQELGAAHDFDVVATEDAAQFTAANLAQFQAVIFLLTSGDVLDGAQQAAFEQYIRGGGGFVGVHSAADTEYGWPWFHELLGAVFFSHDPGQPGTVRVLDRAHPSTRMLPERWVRTDEWYNFYANPRGSVHVLATLDEATVTGGTMGHDHPIAWCREYDGGRSWYTAMGDTAASYSEPLFRAHLLGGIQWAAGLVEGDAGATIPARFEKVVLDDSVTDPMAIEVAADGRVFFIERGGRLKMYSPATQATLLVATLPVYLGVEDGLLGLALDPNFLSNGWIYLYYAPAGAVSENVLARVTLAGNALVSGSERVLLRVATERADARQSSGGLEFGPGGNLYLSVGDNTAGYDAGGYAPIDERPGRAAFDAQKSSANTQSLHGKILRIHPEADGTYSIPAGNLFAPGTAQTRPEIYVMGCRNPFRLAVDPVSGALYFGDVGPDAAADSAARGPRGYDELNFAPTAGNYGWPYFVGNNLAYRDYDFATGASGPAFNPTALINQSPNNTGITTLPAARSALVWYPYAPSPEFPAIRDGAGRAALAGAVYRYDPMVAAETAFPPYFDRTLFLMEWSRGQLYEVKTDASGQLLQIMDFARTISLKRPIDLNFGPDGAMYLLEWGTSFAGGNEDAQLVKILYNPTNRAPVARAVADVTSGPAPLLVHFSSAGSLDPDPGDALSFAWDFELDGIIDSTAPHPTHTFGAAGNYTAQLRVTDPDGRSSTATIDFWVGNTAPTVTFLWPPDGAFFDWEDEIEWSLRVDDPEDGSTVSGGIAPAEVRVEYFLAHDAHAHSAGQPDGVNGATVVSRTHSFGDELSFQISAAYTDRGAPGVTAATGRRVLTLHPKCVQAEHYRSASGVVAATTNDPAGGRLDVAFIDHGDYISFAPMNLARIQEVGLRVAAAAGGARIEIRADAPTGPLVGTVAIPGTGGAGTYAQAVAPVSDPGGTRELFFVFLRQPGDTNLFRVNWICFRGLGATLTPRPPRVASLRALRPANTITLFFDEHMDAASLGVLGHYSLTGANVLAANPGVDGKSVTLATSPLAAGQSYVLAITGVSDLAGETIVPGTRVPFRPTTPILAINCAGPALTATDGTSYVADQSFIGGNTYATLNGIAGTVDDALYRDQRWGFFNYAIPVSNGPYFVTLKLAEIFYSDPGRRVLSATIEGQPVITNLDLVAQVGGSVAYDVSHPVVVSDGVLDLRFTASVDHAVLCALVVSAAPPAFTDFPSWQSFYFGAPGASGAAPGDDPDRDGHDNAAEFAFGGDPTASDSASFAPVLSLTGTAPPKLTLTYKKAEPSQSFRVQWSGTLAPGSWSENGVEAETWFAPTDSYRRSVPILSGETRKFLRLESGP